MKILMCVIMRVDSSDTPLMLHDAMQEMGHEVEMLCRVFDASMLERAYTNCNIMLDEKTLRKFSKRVHKKTFEMKPDVLIIYGSNFYLLPEYLQRIKTELNPKIVLFEGNLQFWRWYQAEVIQFYDECFIADSYFIPVLKGPAQKSGVHYLPGGADPLEHRPLDLSQEDREHYGADISFIGGAWPERIELFKGLKDYKMGLWGPYWQQCEELKGYHREEPVYGLKKTKIYNASKICLNLQNPNTQINGISCRVFEILSCGAFPLSEYRPDMERNFEIGEEIEVYYDEKDLKQKVQYYLSHPEHREAIVQRGRERVLGEHTYRHRTERMLRIIQEGG